MDKKNIYLLKKEIKNVGGGYIVTEGIDRLCPNCESVITIEPHIYTFKKGARKEYETSLNQYPKRVKCPSCQGFEYSVGVVDKKEPEG